VTVCHPKSCAVDICILTGDQKQNVRVHPVCRLQPSWASTVASRVVFVLAAFDDKLAVSGVSCVLQLSLSLCQATSQCERSRELEFRELEFRDSPVAWWYLAGLRRQHSRSRNGHMLLPVSQWGRVGELRQRYRCRYQARLGLLCGLIRRDRRRGHL
jgi:hypothetical protein